MTRMKFSCSECGYEIRVPTSYAGKKGRCPSCKTLLRIPKVAPKPSKPKPEGKLPLPQQPTQRMKRLPKTAASKPARSAKPQVPDGLIPSAKPQTGSPPLRKPSHLLLRVGADPIRLVEGSNLVFGRSESCDLPIPSPRVSRKHAQLTWRQGKPILKDLGSQNGTLVNNKRIYERRLEDGDEILLGPFHITYSIAQPGADLDNVQDFIADSELKTQFTVVDAMSGRLDEITMFEVLQTLDFTKKSGTLEVQRPAGVSGVIGIDAGRVVFATLGELKGEDALYSLLTWDSGTFGLKPDLIQSSSLSLPIMSVLLEAGRRMDEAGS